MRGESERLSIDLVSPEIWQPLLDSAIPDTSIRASAQPQLRQLTESLISIFHGRHIGITPELAFGLAYLLVEPDAQQKIQGPWRAVIDRLRRSLQRASSDKPIPTRVIERQGGFLLRTAPSYTILRLALPLVARACRITGHSVLFCADSINGGMTKRDYAGYSDAIKTAWFALAQSDLNAKRDGIPDDEDAPFWVEIALTFASNALESTTTAPPLPEVDPVSLGWLLRLTPTPEPRIQSIAPPRVMLTPLKRQRSRRLKEGGVTGYRLTRRMEDLDEIVHSELLYPDTMFYDRILNSGYMVVERPPKHQKRRDVLAVAMLPPSLDDQPATGFLKTCWFDCMWRFGAFLRNQELTRSEIRWIEGDQADRARHASYMLSDLPSIAADPNPSQGERWMFLRALRWIPSFFNRRDRPQAIRLAPAQIRSGSPDDAPLPEAQWLRAAWEAQPENLRIEPGIRPPLHPRSWREVIAEFAHTHLMIFLPAERLDSIQAEERRMAAIRYHRRLLTQLHFSANTGTYLSLIFIPQQPLAVERWLFVSSSGAIGLEHVDATFEAIAGAIERQWLDRLLKDMCYG